MEDQLDFDVEIDSAGVGGVGGEDELGLDEDYEDLYDDVNVSFFQPPAAGAAAASGSQAAPGEFQSHGGYWGDDRREANGKANGANKDAPQPNPEVRPQRQEGSRVDPRLELQKKDPVSVAPEVASGGGAAPPATGATPDAAAATAAARPTDGKTSVIISDLHWWTTDAELEAALAEYGRVKGVKFFEERASGKSKGYCQVDFYDPYAAQLCKEKMNGRVFHGRACSVQYATPQVLKQMNMKIQAQPPLNQAQGSQAQAAGKKQTAAGRGGAVEGGRGYAGKPGMGPGMAGGRGPGRGRGRGSGEQFGQMPPGPMGGMNMMGQGYDPAFGPPMRPGMYGMGYMPRGPAYPMPYPGVPPGVAPHVNPAFFGRGANGHSMGMMGNAGWGNGGWGGEESERFGGYEDENAEYGGYSEETGNNKGSSGREQELGGDWQSRKRKDEKDGDWDRERHNKDKEREGERDRGWERDKEKSSYKARDKGSSRYEEDYGRDERDEDYGKKRRHA